MLLQEMSNNTLRWSQATARHSMTQRSTAKKKMGAAEPAQHSTAQPTDAGAGTLQQSTLTSTQHSTEHRDPGQACRH